MVAISPQIYVCVWQAVNEGFLVKQFARVSINVSNFKYMKQLVGNEKVRESFIITDDGLSLKSCCFPWKEKSPHDNW